jgi:multisubunit Na+/H+ antiporter MnhF subunit
MIDTWLAAACFLLLLTAGALFRVVRTKTRYDRYVAAMVAVTIGSTAGLVLSIALGTILVLDGTILLSLVCFAGIMAMLQYPGGAAA